MSRPHAFSFEYLEPRQMLAASALMPRLATAGFGANIFSNLSSLVSSRLAESLQNQHTNLVASVSDASDPDMHGTVHYLSNTVAGRTRTTFNANVEGAAPNASLPVMIDGITVGNIMTNAAGSGRLMLSSNPVGRQQQVLPADFPTNVIFGDAVSIGTATGSLGTTNLGSMANETQHQTTNLVASLSDASNANLSGTVHLVSNTENGRTTTMLIANVQGAQANASLPVVIGGVTVGTLMTNAQGSGQLILSSNPQGNQQALPANFPANIASGAAVSVGAATGNLGTTLNGSGHEAMNLLTSLSDPNNPGVHGMARLLSNTVAGRTTTTFMASIVGAAPTTSLPVVIGGVTVGHIVTNARGSGSLTLSSSRGTLPANFPMNLMAGDAVRVGTAIGSLGTVTSGSGTGGSGQQANVSRLTASLADATNSAVRGMVQFTGVRQMGTINKTFLLTISGAAPNASLPVLINGTNVGTVKTNLAGVGRLLLMSANHTLPANFPSSLTAGSVVTVGTTTTGTLV